MFISSLMVFILRVAQLHIGSRTSLSTFESLWQLVRSPRAITTLTWYIMSAFLFSEVYIFSTAGSANLSWVDPRRSYERPRLNERPVLLRSLFFLLATAQASLHLYRDCDQLPVPEATSPPNESIQKVQEAPPTTAVGSPLVRSKGTLNSVIQRSLSLTITTALAGPFVYFVILRRPAWSMAHGIGKVFFSVPKNAGPSGLTDVTALMVRFVFSALLLTILWEVSNQAFSLYASEQPLKKGVPLTTDSKDANGSLIAGLKAKKELTRSMAFWELAVITDRFDERRKTFYQDFDRKGGSTWAQVSTLCMVEIQSVVESIRAYQKPAAPAASTLPPAQPQTLPRMSQPLKEDNILNAAPRPNGAVEAIEAGIGAVAKSLGQSPSASPASTRARKMLEHGTDKVLSKEQQQQLSGPGLMQQANGYVLQFIQSPAGIVFRQSFARRVNAIVFGTPYSRVRTVQHAIHALCKLTVSSLREDNLGQVQKDVSTIIRVLVSTTQTLQNLLQTLPPHWTDVEFDGKRQVKEVDELLRTLRCGLEQVLFSFGEYADALGLSRSELRAAKEALNKRLEMEVSKK